MVTEKFLDPYLRKTQPGRKLFEKIGDESAEFCRALDDQQRGFPFQTPPDRLDRVEIR